MGTWPTVLTEPRDQRVPIIISNSIAASDDFEVRLSHLAGTGDFFRTDSY
jgi:hypothetical protein